MTREAQALIALFKSCFATDPREPNPGGQPGAAKQGPASRGAGRRSRATTSVAPPDPETTMDQETRARSAEHAEKLDVTGRNLSRWFQDSIITSPIRVDSIDRLLPIDLVRIFDYPGDFVPVITRRGDDAGATGSTSTEQERTHVIDKPALSLQLAQAYVSDLVKEATGSP